MSEPKFESTSPNNRINEYYPIYTEMTTEELLRVQDNLERMNKILIQEASKQVSSKPNIEQNNKVISEIQAELNQRDS